MKKIIKKKVKRKNIKKQENTTPNFSCFNGENNKKTQEMNKTTTFTETHIKTEAETNKSERKIVIKTKICTKQYVSCSSSITSCAFFFAGFHYSFFIFTTFSSLIIICLFVSVKYRV